MSIDRERLKQLLIEIKRGNYTVPEGYTPYKVGQSMMDYIGDTDPILRDDLIYEVLEYFTVNEVFTTSELEEFLNLAFDDTHLFYKLGTIENDSVFTRTFSLLFIAVIIYRHHSQPFLSKEQLITYFNKTMDYIKQEVDVRGFVETKGWAHSVAHSADVLTQFATCSELDTSHHRQLIYAVTTMISNSMHSFIHQEDERCVSAIIAILNQNTISLSDWSQWINNLVDSGTVKEFPNDLAIHINIKHFLRSLYFRILDHNTFENILVLVKDGLSKIQQFK